MIYIFDASFAGSLIIPDEKNHKAEKARALIGEDEDVFAPQLIWYEMASIFRNLIRRNRYSYNEVLQLFPLFNAIRLTTDYETGTHYSQKLLRLCNDCKLSAYDAAYLELAERKNATLCTLDDGLIAAAKKRGVPVLK